MSDVPSTNRLGILFPGAPAIPDMVRLAQKAEDRGFESVWVAETRMTRDGFTPVAAIAAATKRLRIGTGIVNVYTRTPVVIALSFIGLDEIAPGRIVMGLGTGSPLVLAPQGIPFDKPLTRLREYIEVIRPLIRGEEVVYEGTAVELAGARIEDLLSEKGTDGAADRLPLYLGVTGPRALELAGELADGAMLNVCLPTSYVTRALERIGEGTNRAGRSLENVEISMGILTSPDADSAAGKDRARSFIALYLSMFPNIAKETGLDAELLEHTRATFRSEGLEAAAKLVGDDIVDEVAAAGTPEECRARLDDYRRAGVEVPKLIAADGLIEELIDSLAP